MLICDVDLLKLLPTSFYRPILDLQELVGAEEPEFMLLCSFVNQVLNNLFIQTADSGTLTLYEQVLGIAAEPDDDLEFRRWRVMLRWKRRPPYTTPALKEVLNETVGIGNWEIAPNENLLIIHVIIYDQDYKVYNEVRRMLIEYIPAHIQQIIEYSNRPENQQSLLYGMGAAHAIEAEAREV